jgi:hypothetical protein
MKVDLLVGSNSKASARIEKIAGSTMNMVISYIFDKEKRTLGDFAFERERHFGGKLVSRVCRRNKSGEHSADAPAAAQFPRPRKLYVGLYSRARDRLGAGRQSDPKRCGEINLSGQRADLPFDRRCQIGEFCGPPAVAK